MTNQQAKDLIQAAHEDGRLPSDMRIRPMRCDHTGREGWTLSSGFSAEWFPSLKAIARELRLGVERRP